MTEYGLTKDGLIIMRLPEIKKEKEDRLRSVFGNTINLLPEELLGQYLGIESEREALLWELVQAVYNASYPPTAEGVNLDLTVSITGQKRLDATHSYVVGYCVGLLGTVIPKDSTASVVNNPSAKFKTIDDATVGSGTNAVQTISFSNVPTGGAFTLIFDGETTSSLDETTSAADLQAALNALSALSDVTVTGNFTDDFVVTFAGTDGAKPQSLIAYGANTLNMGGVDTDITITETTPGEYPHVEINMIATEKGAVVANAGTLTVIETAVAGWDSITNIEDADIGRNIETDAGLRIRREQTLANPGSSTMDAIYAKLIEVEDVEAVKVYTNRGDFPDGAGRPGKSFECVVKGGADADIADCIWTNCPAGIEMFGTEHVVVKDSQNFDQDVYFSRPEDVDIHLEIGIETDDLFPDNGEDTIKANVLDYANATFGIGQDVITDWLYCPTNCVPGIINITFRIGTAPGPLTDDNIAIGDTQTAQFDSSRITITQV